MDQIKQLPCGISDFKRIRDEGWYYVDKSRYIAQMENSSSYLLFTRPQRFGKSLFLSMVEAYYDLAMRDRWDGLFGGLWIHDHPTRFRHYYQVLRFDFSRVTGSADELKAKFNKYCCRKLNEFGKKYASLYPSEWLDTLLASTDSGDKLNIVMNSAERLGHRLYLIIDEYDNFTNTVLAEHGEGVYRAMTHASGFYRDEFKLYKGMFDRILLMGVSPVTMNDLTSGFNIATNITLAPRYNMALGFSEDDVRQMIRYYRQAGVLDADEDDLVNQMKPWYDNYCFAISRIDADPKMFNSDMVTYFLRSYIENGEPPQHMIAPNTTADYNKLDQLVRLDTERHERRGLLLDIIETGHTLTPGINDWFPAEDITEANNFESLLFHYGMLTIGGEDMGMLKLIIPNNNVRLQYYDYLLREFNRQAPLQVKELQAAFAPAALRGEWKPLLQLMARMYKQCNSVRQLADGERNVQGFFVALFSLCNYYLVAPELELNSGFCDIFLLPDRRRHPAVAHSYIIELKYLRTDDSQQVAAEQLTRAEAQLRQYAAALRVQRLAEGTELHLVAMQFRGLELESLNHIEPIKKTTDQ